MTARPRLQRAPQSRARFLLMENTRFHAGEESNDPALAKIFASLGDVFVNDAFSAAHRAHASTEGIAHLIPAYAGRAMEAELKALGAALESPKRPLVAVIGGAKISTKLDLIGNLAGIADIIVIGGGMGQHFSWRRRLSDRPFALRKRHVRQCAGKRSPRRAIPAAPSSFPADVVVAKEFKAGAANRTIPITDVAGDEMILDLGVGTVRSINAAFDKAATVVWNGPLGAFETEPLRPRHRRLRAPRRHPHQGRQDRFRCRRRRHGRGIEPCRCC